MRKLLLSICCLGCALWAQAKDFYAIRQPADGDIVFF